MIVFTYFIELKSPGAGDSIYKQDEGENTIFREDNLDESQPSEVVTAAVQEDVSPKKLPFRSVELSS